MKRVFAVDVSNEIVDKSNVPENVAIIISDGISIPVEECSVDVAYSNQLIEHLHPDDGQEHMLNVYKALKPGGIYLVITPNKINGPHDISKYFDASATGFHLKEYTVSELRSLFKYAGFRSTKKILNFKGRIVVSAVWPFVTLEKMLMKLHYKTRKRIASVRTLHFLLYPKILGQK